jgi:PIN domain nuclease of toxin-antitoxin system
VLWWSADDPRLGAAARGCIETADAVVMSVASVWELSIKQSLGRIELPPQWTDELAASAVSLLPVHVDHALRVASLPPVHRDPFDRILVAQAQLEDLTIITADPNIPRYDVSTLRAR